MKEIKRKKLGGYPATGVIISITVALFVIGLFGILIIYSQELEQQVRENIRMQVYLKSTLKETQRLQIENKLLSNKYVNKENGKGITYVSKDEAAKKFIAETGEDFTKFIGENPLHDAYLVSIDPSYHSVSEMEKIKAEIQKMNGVYQVYYVEGLIDSVNKNVTKAGLILLFLIVALLLSVVLLINNTLRLALFSQRFLIRSMQLVGAKQWFIQSPFLYRAASYGVLSGLFAAGILWVGVDYTQRKIEDLAQLYDQKQFIMLAIVLVGIGISMAVISTWLAIKKYLRMSLDELY
jgi:cell division transport system permease protein